MQRSPCFAIERNRADCEGTDPQMICTTVTGSASEIGWKLIFTPLFLITNIHHAPSKHSKENVVNRWKAFVKNSSRQPAMRDMRRVLANPRAFAGLGLAAVLVTIIQPFGLRVPGPIGLTLMYWLLIIAVTFPLGFVISAACAAVCRHSHYRPRCLQRCSIGCH